MRKEYSYEQRKTKLVKVERIIHHIGDMGFGFGYFKIPQKLQNRNKYFPNGELRA